METPRASLLAAAPGRKRSARRALLLTTTSFQISALHSVPTSTVEGVVERRRATITPPSLNTPGGRQVSRDGPFAIATFKVYDHADPRHGS